MPMYIGSSFFPHFALLFLQLSILQSFAAERLCNHTRTHKVYPYTHLTVSSLYSQRLYYKLLLNHLEASDCQYGRYEQETLCDRLWACH